MILVSSILTLIAFEFALKSFNIGATTSTDNMMNINEKGIVERSDNKKLVYTFKPNFKGETNSYGFRENKEYPINKSSNKKRILALGDSVAFGVSVNLDKIFLSQLEDKYNKANKNQIEIINLAVSGYNTMQEVELFKMKGLQFKPDEVWIFYVLNDSVYDGAEFAAIGKSHLLFIDQVNDNALFGRLRKNSNLWKIIEDYLLSKEIKNKIEIEMLKKKIKFGMENAPIMYDLMHLDEYFVHTKESFKEIKDLSRTHNFKLKIFICPALQQANINRYKHIHTKVENALTELNIPVVDLLKYLESVDMESIKLSPRDELHLNEKGHTLFSDILLQFIN